jgi:hypothetical protein
VLHEKNVAEFKTLKMKIAFGLGFFLFMCQLSACSNYQVCGQISSKTFNLQG